MTIYVDQSSIFGYQAQLTAIQLQNLRDNLTAIAYGYDNAPIFTTSAYDIRIFDANKIWPYGDLYTSMVTSGDKHDHSVTTKIGSGSIQANGLRIRNFSNSFGNATILYIPPLSYIVPPKGWLIWVTRSGQSYTDHVYGRFYIQSTIRNMYIDEISGLGGGGGLMFFTGSLHTQIYNLHSVDTATIYYRRYFT